VLGELTEQQRGSVRRIRSGVQSILVLLDDLLDLSRAEGDLRIDSQTIDLRDVVRNVVDAFRRTSSSWCSRSSPVLITAGSREPDSDSRLVDVSRDFSTATLP
jgi:signal transduction histidine kinase